MTELVNAKTRKSTMSRRRRRRSAPIGGTIAAVIIGSLTATAAVVALTLHLAAPPEGTRSGDVTNERHDVTERDRAERDRVERERAERHDQQRRQEEVPEFFGTPLRTD